MADDYYVYVYIDPRNHEEFYYGKGRGSRRTAHLSDHADSEKVRIIAEIRREGLEPIVRTIAAGLSEHDAFLIESTLIWKLGKGLANVASGKYERKFRPRNHLHRELAGFDFRNGIHVVNVDEGDTRNWDDCRKYGFLAAGGGRSWSDQIRSLNPGDIVVAYQARSGYVGVARVLETAVPSRTFFFDGQPLYTLPLAQPNVCHDAADDDLCDYVLRVDWLTAVPRFEAKWKSKSERVASGLRPLYVPRSFKASLDGQPATIDFVDEQFGLTPGLRDLADQGVVDSPFEGESGR